MPIAECLPDLETLCSFVGRDVPKVDVMKSSGEYMRVLDDAGNLVGIFPAERMSVADVQKSAAASDPNQCFDEFFMDRPTPFSTGELEVADAVEMQKSVLGYLHDTYAEQDACDSVYDDPRRVIKNDCMQSLFPWSSRE